MTQVSKCQERLLEDYQDDYLFLTNPRTGGSSAVADFLRTRSAETKPDIYHLLRGLGARAGQQQIHWVDAGGGRMLAQRDLAHHYDMTGIKTCTVDLFDHQLDGLDYASRMDFEDLFEGPGPELIQGDVTNLQLSQPADLVTAIELFQYLDDPLATLANLYNQTAPGGLLVVGTAYDWSRSILRKTDSGQVLRGSPSHMPTAELLRELRAHHISFAATREADHTPGSRPPLQDEAFQILAIEKRAGTSLSIGQVALAPLVMPDGYKVQFYAANQLNDAPLLQITED